MNLVIDDAVEVKQATKTEEEKRRNLGKALYRKTGILTGVADGKQVRYC